VSRGSALSGSVDLAWVMPPLPPFGSSVAMSAPLLLICLAMRAQNISAEIPCVLGHSGGRTAGGWRLWRHPPVCVYFVTAPLVAISTSAVAWMSANSSLSKPGANSSRRSGAMVIGNPFGMSAVLSSVPSFDGDAPR
jgi:hypothetical protein